MKASAATGWAAPCASESARRRAPGRVTASASPLLVVTNSRRLTFRMVVVMSRPLSRGRAHRGTDARVGPAAADGAGQPGVDLCSGGFGRLAEERRGLHDLTGLTIAALRHIVRAPGALHRVLAGGAKALNRGHELCR